MATLCEYCQQFNNHECGECAQQKHELEQEAEADKEEANGKTNMD